MIRKILHILLASMILLSSTGLVTHLHYCQNELKEFSFFVEADSCLPDFITVSCPLHPEGMKVKNPDKKDCCEDEIHYEKLDIEQQTKSFEVELIKDFLQLAIIPVNDLHIEEEVLQANHYLNYKPPLLYAKLQSELQTFLC
ncbi:MAG: hypothetical protein AAFR87_05215 [Bacteroidota bacterium]